MRAKESYGLARRFDLVIGIKERYAVYADLHFPTASIRDSTRRELGSAIEELYRRVLSYVAAAWEYLCRNTLGKY